MVKSEKKSGDTEPTITDVMGVVQNLSVSVQDLTEAVQAGFEKVENKLARHEGILTALHEGQGNLTEKVEDVRRRVVNLEHGIEDMRESLADITGAEEKDAKATLNHEHRISHLEKLGGIKGIPTKHLVGLK